MKNILLIGPTDYGFYKHIVNEFELKGYRVLFVKDKLSFRSVILNIMYQSLPTILLDYLYVKLFTRKLNLFCEMNNIKDGVDVFFMIRGVELHTKLLKKLSIICRPKRKVMYQWDFERNLKYLKEQCDFFDLSFSFDNNDAKNHKMKYLPLFFNRAHMAFSTLNNNVKFDFSFIGTHHSDRLELLNSFCTLNKLNRNRCFFSLYRPLSSLLINKVKKFRDFRYVSSSDLNSKMVDELDTISILSSSQVILDFNQAGQNGLTIRTFEALGLQKKLITTNESVRNMDFYHKNNILIIDRDNLVIDEKFLSSKYEPLKKEIYEKYSITKWLEEIIAK